MKAVTTSRLVCLAAFGAALPSARAEEESSVPPVLEVLLVKDHRAQGRANPVELQTLTDYIAAKLASNGAYAVRAAAPIRAAFAAARKSLLCGSAPCPLAQDAPDQAMEVTLGSVAGSCVITAAIVDLRSLASVAGAAERYNCGETFDDALDRLLDGLIHGDDDDAFAIYAQPRPVHLADVYRLLGWLAKRDPSEARRIRDQMKSSTEDLTGLWLRIRSEIIPQPGCTAPRGMFGVITLNTEPYSDIWFDGKKIGETPLAHVKLPSGCWEIKAIAPETKTEKYVKIQVEPNKLLRYQFKIP